MGHELLSAGTDSILSHFEEPPSRKLYSSDMRRRITRPINVVDMIGTSVERAVDGFEDVIDGPLGGGRIYNTESSISQLTNLLEVSPNPSVAEIFAKKDLPPLEIIKALRGHQVLSGVKLLDLGAGRAQFAEVAAALGADAYTVDAEEIRSEVLKGHVTVDLNSENATTLIRNATGGEFDYVTASCLLTTASSARSLREPTAERVLELADALLKEGGYVYAGQTLLRTPLLRKKDGRSL